MPGSVFSWSSSKAVDGRRIQLQCACRSESDSEGAGPAQEATGKTGNNTTTSDSTNFPSFAALRAQAISAAPVVDTKDLALTDGGDVASALAVRAERAPDFNTRTLKHNPKYEDLYGGDRAGEQATAELRKALRNHTSGFVEDTALPSAVFEQQYNEFNANKTAEAPSGQRFGEFTGMSLPSLVFTVCFS